MQHSSRRVCKRFRSPSLEPPFDIVYGRLRAQLERLGLTLESNDLMIAAHALTLDCVLFSDDQAFARVPDLPLENWLRA